MRSLQRTLIAALGATALAVGPTGSDLSYDGGRTWKLFDTGSFDAVECVAGASWASGEQGRVATLRWAADTSCGLSVGAREGVQGNA